MKKILISLLTLFYLHAFAGEIGYIWMANANDRNDNVHNPKKLFSMNAMDPIESINSIIYIKDTNLIIKNEKVLREILLDFRKKKEKKICFNSDSLDFFSFYTNILYKTSCNLNNFIQENKYSNNDLFILDKAIKAKILNVDRYLEGTFLKIEIIDIILDKDFVEKTDIPFEDKTLCDTKEQTIFSCETENNKVISICDNKNNTLSYKYGIRGKIDLEFSSKEKENINNFFKYHKFENSNIEKNEIEFNINKYNYTIYKYFRNNDTLNSYSGIYIEKNNKFLSNIECSHQDEYNYNNFYLLDKYSFDNKDSIKNVLGD